MVADPVGGMGELQRAELQEAADWIAVFMGLNAALSLVLIGLVLWLVWRKD